MAWCSNKNESQWKQMLSCEPLLQNVTVQRRNRCTMADDSQYKEV